MTLTVSIREKKKFLIWFHRKYLKSNLKLSWFFQQLIADEQALFYLRFVHDITDCPRGIRCRIRNGDFELNIFKTPLKNLDLDTIYHDMQLDKKAPMYIRFDFSEIEDKIKLYPVLEDKDITLSAQVDAALQSSLYKRQIALLKEAIDKALRDRDESLFMVYAKALKDLQEQKLRRNK